MSEVREEFRNYFNYFTEVEEQFQRARGTGLFLMSPLDWALVESWKNGGIPLEAALRGIAAAFEKWRAKRNRTQMVNSVAYCMQAVAAEAEAMAQGGAGASAPKREAAPPFALQDLYDFLQANARQYRAAGHEEIAAALDELTAGADLNYGELEALEQRLTALEDILLARLRSSQNPQDAFEARAELDRQLRPYRGKMTASQLAMLEKQYLDRRLMEKANLPRLSLFYMK